MDKIKISEEVNKSINKLEAELSQYSKIEDFNPKVIVKKNYPLFYSNRNVLNNELVYGIKGLLKKYTINKPED